MRDLIYDIINYYLKVRYGKISVYDRNGKPEKEKKTMEIKEIFT